MIFAFPLPLQLQPPTVCSRQSGWSSGTFISNDYHGTLFVYLVFKHSVCQTLFVQKLFLKLLNAVSLWRNPPFYQRESASLQQPMEQKVKHIYRYRYHSPFSGTVSSGSDIKSRNHTSSNTWLVALPNSWSWGNDFAREGVESNQQPGRLLALHDSRGIH